MELEVELGRLEGEIGGVLRELEDRVNIMIEEFGWDGEWSSVQLVSQLIEDFRDADDELVLSALQRPSSDVTYTAVASVFVNQRRSCLVRSCSGRLLVISSDDAMDEVIAGGQLLVTKEEILENEVILASQGVSRPRVAAIRQALVDL